RLCAAALGARPDVPSFPTRRSSDVKVLSRRGVELHLDTALAAVTPENATTADGTVLPTRTVIWAAGVRGNHLVQEMGTEVGRGLDRKSTRLNSSHVKISYAVCCLKK